MSPEYPAAPAVRDMRKDDGGEGDVAGGGAGSVAHQRGQRRGQGGDAGGHEAGQAAPPERVEDDDGWQMRVGSHVSRPGMVRAPTVVAASSPYPPEVCSLRTARATIKALAVPAVITPDWP